MCLHLHAEACYWAFWSRVAARSRQAVVALISFTMRILELWRVAFSPRSLADYNSEACTFTRWQAPKSTAAH
jgi:hypothetical protein